MKKAEVTLKVEGLTQEGVFDGISFQVHKGEILGFSLGFVSLVFFVPTYMPSRITVTLSDILNSSSILWDM